MSLPLVTLSLILGLLLAEARLSRRHELVLRARGAIAPPEAVYAVMAIVYPLSFIAMGVEGALRGDTAPGPFIAGALMFVVSKGLKYWAIGALGERWTFRVFVLPGAPLVGAGPYRYVAHPNYIAVVGELAGTAMMMGARLTGPLFLAAFGAVLVLRIRFETRVLRAAYEDKTDV